jgi:AraC-like DNA-binding protein
MAKGTNALPPLAFGNDIAIVHECAREFTDQIERAIPGMNAYDPLTDPAAFRSKTATLRLPSLTVVATAISPTLVDRSGNPQLTFMVPVAGDAESTCRMAGDSVRWGRGLGGLLLPDTDERVRGTGGFRSHLIWNLQRDRLLQTAQAMLGAEQPVDLAIDRLRLLPQQVAGVSTEVALQGLLPMLQLHRRQPGMLARLGVEDLFYRLSVMLLRPDLFEAPAPPSPGPDRHRRLVDTLCEHIVGHLSEVITLSDLERVSGLSARSLQLAFQQVHGQTPMGWIKEQRLQRVRQAMLAQQDAPIEAVALAAGFQTMPPFFLAYKRRFGETPGQTRQRGARSLTRAD